jgi:hypothetical protein
MTAADRVDPRQVGGQEESAYPAPAIVVGVGKFGLAVLERLGEDWQWLAESVGAPTATGPADLAADASVRNLRLLHIRSASDDGAWRGCEGHIRTLARYVGEDELTALALDMAILRSAGLIRYHEGVYQVAVPRDDGVVEALRPKAKLRPDGTDEPVDPKAVPAPGTDLDKFKRRLRFFHWHTLAPDPIHAAYALREACLKHGDLDSFLSPILDRVRHGDSPRLLMHCIARCRAYGEGRDPTPWSWFRAQLVSHRDAKPNYTVKPVGKPPADGKAADNAPETAAKAFATSEVAARSAVEARAKQKAVSRFRRALPFRRGWLTFDDLQGLLEGRADAPLTSWRHQPGSGPGAALVQCQDLQVPRVFLPRGQDELEAPLDPLGILRLDWETSGWAAGGEQSAFDAVHFLPVESSLFRLGFFDHDELSRVHEPGADETVTPFESRQREFGRLLHRGLVGLWVDMRRTRVHDADLATSTLERSDVEHTLNQSLGILSELVVEPLLRDPELASASEAGGSAPPPDRGNQLPSQPSSRLRSLRCRATSEALSPLQAVVDRLQQLGVSTGAGIGEVIDVFQDFELRVADEAQPSEEAASATAADHVSAQDLMRLRSGLREAVRQLYQFRHLMQYRNRAARRAPRLTVFLVADTREVFARVAIPVLLRELHEELVRAFTPMFRASRSGFDRTITFQPILWMPHAGGSTPADRAPHLEEAAIIESVQSARRWAESVPRERRSVSQIFINSTLTDFAVLSLPEAVRQTRDFISLQIRHDMSADERLRRWVAPASGDDLFATFTCHEIDFPAARARDYLANRFARAALRLLKQQVEGARAGTGAAAATERTGRTTTEGQAELVKAVSDLGKVTDKAASNVEQEFSRFSGNEMLERPLFELRPRLDPQVFDEKLRHDVLACWSELKAPNSGLMDQLIPRVGNKAASGVDRAIALRTALVDKQLEEASRTGGIKGVLEGIASERDVCLKTLRQREAERLTAEQACVAATKPTTGHIGPACDQIRSAVDRKPDRNPMRVGIAFWLLMSFVFGAPLCHAIAKAADAHVDPGAWDIILGLLGGVVGAINLTMPAYFLLRWHRSRREQEVSAALDLVAARASATVKRRSGSSSPQNISSVHDFFEARLRLRHALAERSDAARQHRHALLDSALAFRLEKSIRVQDYRMRQHAELLGVRLDVPKPTPEAPDHDISDLFEPRQAGPVSRLATPAKLHEVYNHRLPDEGAERQALPNFLQGVGGFNRWRTEAVLADAARVLDFGRQHFVEIVTRPVSAQDVFREQVAERLAQFVACHYANVAHGARFSGLEAFDVNGHHVAADSALVIHRDLEVVYTKFRETPKAPPSTRTMDILELPLHPNTAFMLSLVQGIRSDGIRNLRRFETLNVDEVREPDSPSRRYHPVALPHGMVEAPAPLTAFTGHDQVSKSLYAHYRKQIPSSAAPAPAPEISGLPTSGPGATGEGSGSGSNRDGGSAGGGSGSSGGGGGTPSGAGGGGGTASGSASGGGTASGSVVDFGTSVDAGTSAGGGTASGSVGDVGTMNGSASEASTSSGSASEVGTMNGSASEVGTSSGSASDVGTSSGSGGEAGTSSGSASEAGTSSGTASEAGTSSGSVGDVGGFEERHEDSAQGSLDGTASALDVPSGVGVVQASPEAGPGELTTAEQAQGFASAPAAAQPEAGHVLVDGATEDGASPEPVTEASPAAPEPSGRGRPGRKNKKDEGRS